MKIISCPSCNSLSQRLVFRSRDFRFKTSENLFDIVKCQDCSLLFINPHPEVGEVPMFYPADFNKNDDSFGFKIIKPFSRILSNNTIKLLKKYKKEGKLLDIGCGNGSFMLTMSNKGYDVWGVELNAAAEDFTDPSLNGRIFYNDIRQCHLPDKAFDIITMFQSLEHISDINGLFAEVNRVLKDDGILYISVPNTDFFESRLFGAYYYNLEVPRHLYFFTKKSISGFLSRKGLNVKRFCRDSILEVVSTPASLYHGLWYFLTDKKIAGNRKLKSFSFLPLVILRLFLRVFFIWDQQNLKVLCKKVDNVKYS